MLPNDANLTTKQKKLIGCLLTQSTLKKACACAGISRATGYRYMKLDYVQEALSERIEAALVIATAFSSNLQGEVAAQLWKIALEAEKDSDKIAALGKLASMALPLYQATTLTKLLRKIEIDMEALE